jgi:hypothetical protein
MLGARLVDFGPPIEVDRRTWRRRVSFGGCELQQYSQIHKYGWLSAITFTQGLGHHASSVARGLATELLLYRDTLGARAPPCPPHVFSKFGSLGAGHRPDMLGMRFSHVAKGSEHMRFQKKGWMS